MSHYEMEAKLPSTTVSRDLVKSLETFIIARARAAVSEKLDADEVLSALKITITDGQGSETMSTIDDFVPTKFPDTTKEIRIAFDEPWLPGRKGLRITIRFTMLGCIHPPSLGLSPLYLSAQSQWCFSLH